nr:probable LRR receptor-like serine/threonine-protein kinase At1g06840 [Tanacetum cinerariifolium]
MRLRVALDSAKAILYLHTEVNPPIFYQGIKTSNILIDSKLTSKIADFGLSRLTPSLNDYGVGPNYVSTVVRGSPVLSLALWCYNDKPEKGHQYQLPLTL